MIAPPSWPPVEESPPPGAPQQADCSLEVVQPRQLQGAAVERLDGLPQLLVVMGGFQLVGGGGMGCWATASAGPTGGITAGCCLARVIGIFG